MAETLGYTAKSLPRELPLENSVKELLDEEK